MGEQCAQPRNCLEKFRCLNPPICSDFEIRLVDGERYYELLCKMTGYWELDKNNLFFPFLGSNNIINQTISNDQRKHFLKMTRKIFKFDYFKYQDSNGYDKNKSYFYLKIIDKDTKTNHTIKCRLACPTAGNSADLTRNYEFNTLFRFVILDFNLSTTNMYFYLGIRTVDGSEVLTFDAESIPKNLSTCNSTPSPDDSCSAFTINNLQELGIPIFKFDLTNDMQHQSIYLIPYASGTNEMAPSNMVDIENAKKEADKKCVQQLNRLNNLDINCQCINTNTGENEVNCDNRNILNTDVTMPKYCSYLGNINNDLQRGLSACQTQAYITYQNEIKNLNPNNPQQYDKWLNSDGNDDNLLNVTAEISNKYKNINNELMTKCPKMKLGLNGVINNELRNSVIQDDLVNKVVDKYIEKSDELDLELFYDREQSENMNIQNDDGEYYSNIHPLKECKYDSYKLLQQMCQDYSLPSDEDSTAFVLPKKCNITDLKNLIHECNIKNVAEVQGDSENNILERILPYNFEVEEDRTGKFLFL